MSMEKEGGERGMWISKKKWQAMEKRVADLEGQVQSQPKEILNTISQQLRNQMKKNSRISRDILEESVK